MKIVDFHGGGRFASVVGDFVSEGSNFVARVALSRGALAAEKNMMKMEKIK